MRKLLSILTLVLSVLLVPDVSVSAPVRSMLGADGIERMDESPTYTAADYIQDGLIALWDGIENAGSGLHDDNATVWTDLTGNGFDAVCAEHGPKWSDSFCYIADDTAYLSLASYVYGFWKVPNATFANLYSLVSTDDGYTVECIAMQTDARQYLFTPISGFAYNYISTTWYGRSAGWTVNTQQSSWGGRFEGDQTYLGKEISRVSSSPSQPYQTFSYSVATDFGNKTTSAYYNGEFLQSIGFAAIMGNSYNRFTFSPWLSERNGTFVGNRLYCTRLYNRALTAEEIEWNNFIDKVRFGL